MNLHEDYSRREQAQEPSDRLFCLAVAAGLAITGLLPLISGRPVRVWALAGSSVLAVVGLIRASLVSPFRRVLTRIIAVIGSVVTTVTAALLFYLVVTPTGLIARLKSRDPLGLRFDAGAASYWKRRHPPGPSPETMPRQF